MDIAVLLVRLTRPFEQTFVPASPIAYIRKLVTIGRVTLDVIFKLVEI